MPRIHPINSEEAGPKSRALLESVQKSLGMTPNMMSTLAHSPAALQSYLGFSQALSGAEIGPDLREQIALAVAGENGCAYCASAHTLLGGKSGVGADELERNLRGRSGDPRTQAALDFARAIVARRGLVEDADVAAIRRAGFSEGAIVEVIATVALNIFTNYFNHVTDPEIDFPVVEVGAATVS